MDSSVYGFVVIMLLINVGVFTVVGLWKLFEKAYKPGWASIIPVYNIIVLFQIIGKPMWQLILLFIPPISLYIIISMVIGLCKSFGKSETDNYLLAVFFGFIYIPYLGFSSNIRYIGPAGEK